MNILIRRMWPNSEAIIGAFYVDGASQGFTLELPRLFDGRENVPSKTCIPAGKYLVLREFSHHFDHMMPHVMAVPGRSDIEIHPGNTPADIRGCILVGEERLGHATIGSSRKAFFVLDGKMENAWANNEQVWIEIRNEEALPRG